VHDGMLLATACSHGQVQAKIIGRASVFRAGRTSNGISTMKLNNARIPQEH